ncbi:MAG: hypothetical protein ACM33T_05250 [Solirubrobacterales bacterium]
MSYPLFDSNFTLWAADLDARLMDLHGLCSRRLGIEPRVLMEHYYRGETVTNVVARIEPNGEKSA